MQKITPCLWFDNQAEEAAKFYCSIFRKSKIVSVGPVVVEFRLGGQDFLGLNGGPIFKFNEAVSLSIACKDQKEVDYYWDRLLDGGKESQCGWLKDRYGLSWQVVPTILPKLLYDKDKAKAQRAMQAMLKMRKLDIKALKQAHAG